MTLLCPCCGGSSLEFLPFGVIPRNNARCPACGSLERHRALWAPWNGWVLVKVHCIPAGPNFRTHMSPAGAFSAAATRGSAAVDNSGEE